MKPACDPVETKLARLAGGATPRVLDLFSGCGGISLGFQRAGFEIIGGVEADADAAWNYAINIHRREPEVRLSELGVARDITALDPVGFLRQMGFPDPTAAVDVVVGGPPCQAYARVGRAKLREVKANPEAFQKDARGSLYQHYLRFVAALQPLALMMENVPDLLNYGGRNVAEEIAENLEELGYVVAYTLMNAASYSVPQLRERLFLVAYHRRLGLTPAFPCPTHNIPDPPSGYKQTRAFARRLHREGQLGFIEGATDSHFLAPGHLSDASLPDAVSASEAVGDLPSLAPAADQRTYQPARFVAKYVREHILSWPGLEVDPGQGPLPCHRARSLSNRDYRLFRRMAPDDEYDVAFEIATAVLTERLDALRELGVPLPEQTEAARGLHAALVRFRGGGAVGDADFAALLETWWALKGDVEKVQRVKKEYAEALETLRTRLDDAYLDASHVVLDLRDTWDSVEWALRHRTSMGAVTSLDLRKLLATKDRLLRQLFHHRRTRDAHGRLPVSMLPPRPRELDLDEHQGLGAIRERRFVLRRYRDRMLEARRRGERFTHLPCDVEAMLDDVVELGVVRLSQQIGEWQRLVAVIVPPYDPCKFANKWRKMSADRPARTLMAHLGKDGYTHIHYDSEQTRTISIREAARLQSFPDGFLFDSPMNPAFRQIGNAVPPLLADAIATEVACTLERAFSSTQVAAG